MPLWKVKAVRDEFYYGHPCTEIDAQIHHPSNFTYCKNAPSMFFQTPLITFLVRQAVDTVIVTGCTTSGCVRATIIDAFSYGFRVLVPQDCVGDADETQHRSNLADVARRYADVTDSKAIRAYFGDSAGRIRPRGPTDRHPPGRTEHIPVRSGARHPWLDDGPSHWRSVVHTAPPAQAMSRVRDPRRRDRTKRPPQHPSASKYLATVERGAGGWRSGGRAVASQGWRAPELTRMCSLRPGWPTANRPHIDAARDD
jgi:hypothetical protein